MPILPFDMGEQKVKVAQSREARGQFIRHLLHDIQALERMLSDNLIESGISRIGAEQEFCLVDRHWRPATNSGLILDALDDSHYKTELARYNIEINLDPEVLEGPAFSRTEKALKRLLNKATQEARKRDSYVILTGILPTISKNELEIEFMTPMPRYYALNEAVKRQRKADFSVQLDGVDELSIMHDSVLFEACNTSFQIHLQVDPSDFVSSYNWAQAIAAPVLGMATNSPILLGRELWSETRIALFQQSIDTRLSSYALKEQEPRVSFGSGWEHGSVAEIFKNDIARHRVILARPIEEDSLDILNKGEIPRLQALCVHNGTVYRWNRPCYGVGNGRAHVRIENRYLPSGPTTLDEMANFAFWTGLMAGRPTEFDHLPSVMDFRDAKSNFFRVARYGKESVLHWRGKARFLTELVEKELLPLAYDGLRKKGVDDEDIARYLEVIEGRLKGKTGSQWLVSSFRKARTCMKKDDALTAITRSLYYNQRMGTPVHKWDIMEPDKESPNYASRVEHIMSTQLFTVLEKDLALLATSLMRWKNIHHVPVEDEKGALCGLLTWTHLIRNEQLDTGTSLLVEDIMEKNVISVVPSTSIREAIRIMKEYVIGCLPVAIDKELVGIITIEDVIRYDQEPKTKGKSAGK